MWSSTATRPSFPPPGTLTFLPWAHQWPAPARLLHAIGLAQQTIPTLDIQAFDEAALWEQMQDKTRITGAIIDPLGRSQTPDKTRIDGTLIGSQSPSRTAEG